MPRAAGCQCCAKCSGIGSTTTEGTETGSNGVGDGQCNKNGEKDRREEKVGQTERYS